MPGAHPFYLRFTISAAMLVGVWQLGYCIQRPDFQTFIIAYILLFAVYLWVIWQKRRDNDWIWWIGVGISLRVVLLFSLPNLSDDFYRFLWDGRLSAHGIHPFAHPPSYFVTLPVAIPGITPELFHRLNSPDYFTVYPPVCQGVFWLAAKIFPDSISGGVFVLKLFLLACEAGTIALLVRFRQPATGIHAGLAYALNPLVVLEISGNCHFEGAMIFFLLAGSLALSRERLGLSAGFWALATGSKLVPLLFLPVVWAHLGWRRGFRFIVLFVLMCAGLFAPLLQPETVRNMAGSLNLYFRQFEFNASFYYLLKWAGEALAPPSMDVARTLGPVLALLAGCGVLVLTFVMNWYSKKRNQPQTLLDFSGPSGLNMLAVMVLASTLHIAFSTTVHPWYISLPFALSLLTPWRYPLVWTGAAALSYSHYAGGGFREQYGWVALEYLLVAAAFLSDIRRIRQNGLEFQ